MKKLLLIITVFIAGCEKKEISKNDIISSEKILGIEFSSSERDSLINTVTRRLGQYEALREIDIPNNISFPLFAISSALSRTARFILVSFLIWKFGPKIKHLIEYYFNFLTILLIIILLGSYMAIKLLIGN